MKARRPDAAQRCRAWNADRAHQAKAGQARAAQFTRDYQTAAGNASWSAFSARWRAGQGIAPLSAEAVRRYVTPEMIRGPLGAELCDALRQQIYEAWCAGQLVGVLAWLSDEQDPPLPPGNLWEQAGA